MSAILIISIFLVFVASLALLRTKRSSSSDLSDYLPPGLSPGGLFGDTTPGLTGAGSPDVDDKGIKASQKLEKSLLDRAARGDLEALQDARTGKNAQVYRRVLDVLVERAAKDEGDLRALVVFVTRDAELRSSSKLAELLLVGWEREPTRAGAVELLHVAALSDDAQTFERTLEAVLRAGEESRLSSLSAGELRSLFEGEYWLLSSEAQRSGAGFALKQKLSDARRRLSTAARREAPSTDGDFQREASAQKERQ